MFELVPAFFPLPKHQVTMKDLPQAQISTIQSFFDRSGLNMTRTLNRIYKHLIVFTWLIISILKKAIPIMVGSLFRFDRANLSYLTAS